MSMQRPDSFIFNGWQTNTATGEIYLDYAFDNGLAFRETITFSAPLPDTDSPMREGFEAALDGLSIAAGVSYYKAFAPRKMILASGPYSAAQRAFFQSLYVNGLGEFGYRNGVDIGDRVNFLDAKEQNGDAADADTGPGASPASLTAKTAAPALPRRSAVMLGAGKDSLASVEIMRNANEPFSLLTVNPKRPHLAGAAASDYPLWTVKREISPLLIELNDKGAMNGHVPITAIVSFIAAAAAFVHGYDTIIMSNERSSDEGNLEENGVAINHQYSKTYEFERLFQTYVTDFVSKDLSYFSLLRPLSEAHIAQLFARTDRYDGVFTSCNKAFRLTAGEDIDRWCCDCAKCRFAFLILATALSPDRMIAIFGKNMLDDETQLDGYAELVGLSGHKPWDCVGEIVESASAMAHLSTVGEWNGSCVVKAIATRLKSANPAQSYDWGHYFIPDMTRKMKTKYAEALLAYIKSA